jgi:ArsR family transcriptional regulator, arsenate/arsenite/antimonite-responsive transcriptional repressor
MEDLAYSEDISNEFDLRGADSMNKQIPLKDISLDSTFSKYEKKFKALADQKRLFILRQITEMGEVCVCDLSDKLDLPQSKLSYHLKILMDAELILKETRGTWSYYTLNHTELNHLLSEQLCCLFRRE